MKKINNEVLSVLLAVSFVWLLILTLFMVNMNNELSDLKSARTGSVEESITEVTTQPETPTSTVSIITEESQSTVNAKDLFQSKKTNVNSEFPYAVSEDQIADELSLSFKAIMKHTSKNPDWIYKSEPQYTDRKSQYDIFVDGSSPAYDYVVENIPTKTINIETEDGIQTTEVNTEIAFTVDPKYGINSVVEPGYFYIANDGKLYLAMKNYDGEDYYMLFVQS